VKMKTKWLFVSEIFSHITVLVIWNWYQTTYITFAKLCRLGNNDISHFYFHFNWFNKYWIVFLKQCHLPIMSHPFNFKPLRKFLCHKSDETFPCQSVWVVDGSMQHQVPFRKCRTKNYVRAKYLYEQYFKLKPLKNEVPWW
jgi:hypothetical protein